MKLETRKVDSWGGGNISAQHKTQSLMRFDYKKKKAKVKYIKIAIKKQ